VKKDGSTERDNLEAAQRQMSTPITELEPVECHICIQYIWGWFCELSGGRNYADGHPMPLSYSEIESWANLTKTEPTAWEIGVIKQIDRVFLTEAGKK